MRTSSLHRVSVSLRLLGVALVGAFLSGGCQEDVVTQFPDGLIPIEENTATPPAPTETDPFPEVRSFVTGDDDGGGWLHGYAYVKAPVSQVWDAFQDTEVVADRRAITYYEARWDVEPEYDVSFVTRYFIEDLITVSFDLTWRQSVVEGTLASPKRVIAAYQKTWGSSLVRRMAGTVELLEVAPNVTRIGWVQRLDGARVDSTNVAAWNADQFTNVVRKVRGEPLLSF